MKKILSLKAEQIISAQQWNKETEQETKWLLKRLVPKAKNNQEARQVLKKLLETQHSEKILPIYKQVCSKKNISPEILGEKTLEKLARKPQSRIIGKTFETFEKNADKILILLAISAVFLRFWDINTPDLTEDEGHYARDAILGGIVGQDYLRYHFHCPPEYCPFISGSKTSHGTLQQYLILGATRFLGYSDALTRSVSIIAFFFTMIYAYLLAKKLGSKTGAVATTSILTFLPYMTYYSRFTRPDILIGLWVTSSLYFLLIKKSYLTVGVLSGLNIATKRYGPAWHLLFTAIFFKQKGLNKESFKEFSRSLLLTPFVVLFLFTDPGTYLNTLTVSASSAQSGQSYATYYAWFLKNLAPLTSLASFSWPFAIISSASILFFIQQSLVKKASQENQLLFAAFCFAMLLPFTFGDPSEGAPMTTETLLYRGFAGYVLLATMSGVFFSKLSENKNPLGIIYLLLLAALIPLAPEGIYTYRFDSPKYHWDTTEQTLAKDLLKDTENKTSEETNILITAFHGGKVSPTRFLLAERKASCTNCEFHLSFLHSPPVIQPYYYFETHKDEIKMHIYRDTNPQDKTVAEMDYVLTNQWYPELLNQLQELSSGPAPCFEKMKEYRQIRLNNETVTHLLYKRVKECPPETQTNA